MIFRALIIPIVMVILMSASYAADSPFEVDDISAYSEDENEVLAQSNALDIAKKKGLMTLFERLLISSQLERIKSINKSKFDACLSDYNYKNQRITSTSFMAKFQLKFDEQCVRKNLNKLGMYFTNVYSDPTLVIPIFARNNKLYIWDYESGYAIYEELPDIYGMSRFRYVAGDLMDSSLFSPEMSKDKLEPKRFQRISSRYGIAGIFYLKFVENDKTIAFTIIQENADERKEIFNETINIQNNDTADVYRKLFEKSPALLDDYYKKHDLDI